MAPAESSTQALTLYTYFRSSCSARIRIALNIKDISHDSKYVNLLKGDQSSPGYGDINPSHFVPSVVLDNGTVLTQSLAILEYLEESHPPPGSTALLPPAEDTIGRAQVRALANIIACDVQPVTNLRILSRVAKLGATKEDWAKDLMSEGLQAYEKIASTTASEFSFGDQVTIADICLVPAVWGALRFGVSLDELPVVKKVYENMSALEAVKRAHWNSQEDTPAELKA